MTLKKRKVVVCLISLLLACALVSIVSILLPDHLAKDLTGGEFINELIWFSVWTGTLSFLLYALYLNLWEGREKE